MILEPQRRRLIFPGAGGGDIKLNSASTCSHLQSCRPVSCPCAGVILKVKKTFTYLQKKKKNRGRASDFPGLSMLSDLTQRRQQREAVAALRRRHRIHVSPQTPDPIASFDEMPKSILAVF